MRQGAADGEIDIARDVYLGGDLFRLKLPGAGPRGKDVVVTITAKTEAKNRLHFNCTACQTVCQPRRRGRVADSGREDGLGPGRRADGTRAHRKPQRRGPRRTGPRRSARAGRDGEVPPAIRPIPTSPGATTWSPVPCPAKPTAWPCAATSGASRIAPAPISAPTPWAPASTSCTPWTACGGGFPAASRQKPYRNREAFVHVLYGEEIGVAPAASRPAARGNAQGGGRWPTGRSSDVRRLVECLGRLQRLGHEVKVYPDAEELIQRRLFQQRPAPSGRRKSRRTRHSTPCARNS